MKQFFFLAFVAGVIASVFWAVIMVAMFVMHRMTILTFLSTGVALAFFIWATREMYESYQAEKPTPTDSTP